MEGEKEREIYIERGGNRIFGVTSTDIKIVVASKLIPFFVRT